MKGSAAYPETLNAYGYCWGNPVMFVDKDGAFPTFIIIPVAFFVATVLSGCDDSSKHGGKKSGKEKNKITTEQDATTVEVPQIDNAGISIEDYHVEDRNNLIKFIKYAEGDYQEKPYDLFHKLQNKEVYLTPNEIDAIVSLAFNVGAGELNTNSPNFTQLLISKGYTKEDIKNEFLTYLGEDSVIEGLRKRRIAEAKIFNDNKYNFNYRECDFE